MSKPEQEAIENSFRLWKEARMAGERDDDAFEVFSTELILKDADLSDEDIASGKSGGSGDGGVDGYFFFRAYPESRLS